MNFMSTLSSVHCFLLSVFLMQQSRHFCNGAVSTLERKLLADLFANYDKNSRPTINPGNSVNVTFGISVRNILGVDDRQQLLNSRVWVRQAWRNELMRWNSSMWGNITQVSMNSESVWLPDIVLYNDASDKFPGGTEIYKTNVIAYANGTHTWNSPASFMTSCTINVKFFPFDEQTCFFQFGSWSFHQGSIDIFPGDAESLTSNFVPSSEWKVTSSRTQRNVIKYDCCENPFVDIQFFITLKRQPLYYIITLLVPCLLLLPLTTVSFYLPPASGERIGLTITILLAVAVFLEVTNETLPRYSSNPPLIGVFFLAVMIATAMSLITTGFVLFVHFKGESDFVTPVPRTLKKLFLGKLARILGIKEAKMWKRAKKEEEFENARVETGNILDNKQALNVIHDEKGNNTTKNRILTLDEVPKVGAPNESTSSDTKILLSVLDHVSYATNYLKEGEKKDSSVEEWKILAMVIDRVIFVLFLLSCIILCLAVLVPVVQH